MKNSRLLSRIVPLTLFTAIMGYTGTTNAPAAPQSPFPQTAAGKTNPPPGVAIPEPLKAELTQGIAELAKEIADLRESLKDKRDLLRYLPDVMVYEKAVRYAVENNEFFKVKEAETAKTLLAQGKERAKQLREGKAPWTTQTGLVVLGYISKIDGSVQPYGLVVPPTYRPNNGVPPKQHRLDFFFHGRGDTLSEVNFIDGRQKSPGEFTPPDTFVLHPYGRFCNANRFAGEVDLFEAMDDVKARYPIDPDRVVVRGFSMGGAACWMFGTHHASLWAAVAPGAGFSETADYTGAFGSGKTPPPWYEQKLWNLYDSTAYAENLANTATVAYSGEIDKQKQAADKMAEAMKAAGLEMKHVIGPQTAHKYHPDSKKEINAFVDEAAAKGRDRMPAHVRFVTYTLRYNKMAWVRLEGLGEHWKKAHVDASFENGTITATTENVTGIVFERSNATKVVLDGQTLNWAGRYVKDARTGKWRGIRSIGELRTDVKRPGLQGPIDDAFMSRFLFVRPTGTPLNPAIGAWTKAEMEKSIRLWRTFYRGDVMVVDDTEALRRPELIGPLSSYNIIVWGDPQSNAVLKSWMGKLPVQWAADGIKFGGKTYPADKYAPVLIYPKPQGGNRYVVLNSGFTFQEFTAASNAQHTPKLPDWAIVDITMGPDLRAPGKVAAAGFFDEEWKIPANSGATTATRSASTGTVDSRKER
jgi:dienelactone hydrolase